MSRHSPLAGEHDTARLHAGPRVSAHNKCTGCVAVSMIAPIRSQLGVGRAAERLYRDRELSVATRVIEFHVSICSTVSRHGTSATRAFVVTT